MGAEVLDVDLLSHAVRPEQVGRHGQVLIDDDRPVSVGRQRDLVDAFVSARLPRDRGESPRRLALRDAAGAFPAAGEDARAEVTAGTEVSLDLAVPLAQSC